MRNSLNGQKIGSDTLKCVLAFWRFIIFSGGCFLAAAPVGVHAFVWNDEFVNANPISATNGTIVWSNIGATTDPKLGVLDINNSVWWKLTAVDKGLLTVNTYGSNFDTVIGVYADNPLGVPIKLSENDNNQGTQSAVSLPVEKGNKYYIAVGGHNNSSFGVIRLNWMLEPYGAQLKLRPQNVTTDGLKLQLLNGTAKTKYRIDWASNLERWRELGVASALSDSEYYFLDPTWSGDQSRFYRAVEAGGSLRIDGRLNYGVVATETATTRFILIHNLGNIPLRVDGIDLPFGFYGNWRGLIPVGGRQEVPITFQPSRLGEIIGDLTIQGNASGGGATVPIVGRGEKPLLSLGFLHPDTRVHAAFAGSDETPGVVVMRSPQKINHLVVAYRNGFSIEMIGATPGRPDLLNVEGHRLTFSNYTSTAVTVYYRGPEGQTDSKIVMIQKPALGKSLLSSSKSTTSLSTKLDYDVNKSLEYFSDITKTHWVLSLYREYIAEPLYELFLKAGDTIEELANTGIPVERKVNNQITYDVAAQDAGQKILEQSPEFFEELRQVDPDAETTAGFKVTANGIEPDRDSWDALLNSGSIKVDFITQDGVAGRSVFSEMNPRSPSYVPPLMIPQSTGKDCFTRPNTTLNGILAGKGSIAKFVIITPPSHGTLQLRDAVSGSFTYVPNRDYVGPDSFTFAAENRGGRSAPATVSIEVGALAAFDILLETVSGQPVIYSLSGSSAQYFEIVRQPANGTITLHDSKTGQFTYRPAAGFSGKDTFSFVAIQGTDRSLEAMVTIQVTDNRNECRLKWKPLLLGKWRITEHPLIKPSPGYPLGYYADWTWEFKATGSLDLLCVENKTQMLSGSVRNPIAESWTSYRIIYDSDNDDRSSNCALSYNSNPLNSYNIQLLSGDAKTIKFSYLGNGTMVKE